jgi:hypothetical protein
MAKIASKIKFTAKLHRPAEASNGESWTFLNLPKDASDRVPTRSMHSVEGTMNGFAFQATLQPDGAGGHWLQIDQRLREGAGAEVGDEVAVEIVSQETEPEPEVPGDFQAALDAANAKARATWSETTAIARRDWISWMTTGKRAETRPLRIGKAIDMLSKGKRRICCYDRSGVVGKNFSCPVAADV